MPKSRLGLVILYNNVDHFIKCEGQHFNHMLNRLVSPCHFFNEVHIPFQKSARSYIFEIDISRFCLSFHDSPIGL